MPATPGIVFLVGAGPGDPELITLRGAEVLGLADVVVYDGLANAVLLDHAPAHAEKIYAGKKRSPRGAPLTQRQIEDVLVEHALLGKTVVRLKGGDPFVFGRGGEEAERLVAEGIPFEIVPGVTAATAVPAYAGIPLTHRDVASTAVVLATGHGADGQTRPIDWTGVSRADTIVLFMAVTTLAQCAQELVAAGRAASTPVAVIRWGTTAEQRTLTGTLGDIAARVAAANLQPPALVVIGDVVRYRERLAWFESRPLFGARVLVPRQREQARGFARVLVALGAEPVICEVTRLVEGDTAALDQALAALPGAYRWIAFTSANGVERTFAALDRLGWDARILAGTRLAAVGSATAAALRRFGLRADLVPERSDGTGVARALLDADPDLASGAVLLPRAAEGREELATILASHGVSVTSVAAYRTVPAVASVGGDLEPVLARLRAGTIDVVTFFAPSQVDALAQALGPDAASVLGRARLVAAIGETTRDALVAQGVRVDVVAPAPSATELAHALIAPYRAARRPDAHSLPEDR